MGPEPAEMIGKTLPNRNQHTTQLQLDYRDLFRDVCPRPRIARIGLEPTTR